MEYLDRVLDWAWALVLLVLGGVGKWASRLSGRVDTLEQETMPSTKIEERIKALENGMRTTMTAQHNELKAELHRLVAAQSESQTRIYKKIDDSRAESKADFRAELNAALTGMRGQKQ